MSIGRPSSSLSDPGGASVENDSRQGARVCLASVHRRFPGTGPVIDDVSLVVEPGEFVALLGPSGCGKSTLLRLAAGLDLPDEGQVEINSFERRFFRGFVFQDSHLLPWRTVLQNVALPLELIGRERSAARDEATSVLERVGLRDALERYPNQLSGGMKMRVSVARSLVARPTLLLLDEPFAALDENTRHRLQEDLRLLWEREPVTVLFVTHSVSEAVYLANRAVVFSPRPARIYMDHPIALPRHRPGSIRTESVFVDEIKHLQTAFSAIDSEDSGD
jgi:NitT/TauT family transport system ATP-binding protein